MTENEVIEKLKAYPVKDWQITGTISSGANMPIVSKLTTRHPNSKGYIISIEFDTEVSLGFRQPGPNSPWAFCVKASKDSLGRSSDIIYFQGGFTEAFLQGRIDPPDSKIARFFQNLADQVRPKFTPPNIKSSAGLKL